MPLGIGVALHLGEVKYMVNKITNFLFDKTGVPKLQKFLDLSSLRHKLISGNIANTSTSGYKSRDINFQDEFNKATGERNNFSGSVTHSSHIPLGNHASRGPRINATKVESGDFNSIDIDKEVSKMAQNELLFSIGAKMLKDRFDGLRKVITSK